MKKSLDYTTNIGRRDTEILFSNDLASLADVVKYHLPFAEQRVIAIVDQNVEQHYSAQLPFEKILICADEEHKTMETVYDIVGQLLAMKADRNIFLLGVGGGITTDLTGFIGSIYKRGVRFGFVPTTLLAMADASIGGKNGVNVQHYKNMLGTITQPNFVIISCNFLKTLPKREFYSAIPEIFKVVLLAGHPFEEFHDFFKNIDYNNLFDDERKMAMLSNAIYIAIDIKRMVMANDPYDCGSRRWLNFGHTFAHAIEYCTNRFLHGEAVGIGMILASRNAHKTALASRIEKALRDCGLPTQLPDDIPKEKLLEAMMQDKKNYTDKIVLVTIDGKGNVDFLSKKPEEIEMTNS